MEATLLGSALDRFVRVLSVASAGDPSEIDDYLQEAAIVFMSVARRYAELPEAELVLVAKKALRNRFRDLYRRKSSRLRREEDWRPQPNPERKLEVLDAIDFLTSRLTPQGGEFIRCMADGLSRREAESCCGLSRHQATEVLNECRAMSWRVG